MGDNSMKNLHESQKNMYASGPFLPDGSGLPG